MKKDVIVLTDADNTLWDTNAVFRQAQINLFARVAQSRKKNARVSVDHALAVVRELDQGIAAIHHAHLRYPSQLLVIALQYYLDGLSASLAVQGAINGLPSTSIDMKEVSRLELDFQSDLNIFPSLLDSVLEGLKLARSLSYQIVMITEGRLAKQREIQRFHGIDGFFSMEIELTKSDSQFQRLARRFAGSNVFMIGDQLDRDIIPALNSGVEPIYVRGGFQPEWNKGVEGKFLYRQADCFFSAIDLIRKERGIRVRPSPAP